MRLLALGFLGVAFSFAAKHYQPAGSWPGACGVGFGAVGAAGWLFVVPGIWSGRIPLDLAFGGSAQRQGPRRAHSYTRAALPGGLAGVHLWLFGCWLFFYPAEDAPPTVERVFLVSAALTALAWVSVIWLGRPRFLMPLRYRRTRQSLDEIVAECGDLYE